MVDPRETKRPGGTDKPEGLTSDLAERIRRAQETEKVGQAAQAHAAKDMSGWNRGLRLGSEFIAAILVGAGIGWIAGSLLSLRIRRVPRNPLITGLTSTLTFLGAVAFALMGATNLLKFDAAEFPVVPGIPIPEPDAVDAVVFLVGDAGDAVTGHSPLLTALQEDVNRWSRALRRDSAVSVIYLGDNVYPDGVRDRADPHFPDDSARLWSQVGVLDAGDARRYHSLGLFVAGNHDWGNATGDAGIARLVNQGALIATARQNGHLVSLLPDAGQPGPVFRDLRQNVRIVFLDTHWFLQERGRDARRDFFLRTETILRNAGERSVILVSHQELQQPEFSRRRRDHRVAAGHPATSRIQ